MLSILKRSNSLVCLINSHSISPVTYNSSSILARVAEAASEQGRDLVCGLWDSCIFSWTVPALNIACKCPFLKKKYSSKWEMEHKTRYTAWNKFASCALEWGCALWSRSQSLGLSVCSSIFPLPIVCFPPTGLQLWTKSSLNGWEKFTRMLLCKQLPSSKQDSQHPCCLNAHWLTLGAVPGGVGWGSVENVLQKHWNLKCIFI